MEYKNNLLLPQNSVLVFIVIGIILLYPTVGGLLIYLPHIVLGILAIYSCLRIPKKKPIKSFIYYTLYMFTMSLIISSLNTNDNILSIVKSSMQILFPLIGLLLGALFYKWADKKFFLYCLLFFLIFEFMLVYLQVNNEKFRYVTYYLYRTEESAEKYLESFLYETGKRSFGSIGNPNALGIIAVVLNISIQFLTNTINNFRLQKYINITALIISIYIIIRTQSRTSMILYIITFVIMYYIKSLHYKNIKPMLFAVFFAVMLYVYMTTSVVREINYDALSSRYDIWKMHFDNLYSNSFVENVFISIFGLGFSNIRNMGTFDNNYLRIFVSSGIFGIVIYFKAIYDLLCSFIKPSAYNSLNKMGIVLIIVIMISSCVLEYNESFRISILTYSILGYALYSDS